MKFYRNTLIARTVHVGVKTVSKVSWFQDRLGWLVENYPGLFKWLGNLETKTVAYQIAEIPIHRPYLHLRPCQGRQHNFA